MCFFFWVPLTCIDKCQLCRYTVYRIRKIYHLLLRQVLNGVTLKILQFLSFHDILGLGQNIIFAIYHNTIWCDGLLYQKPCTARLKVYQSIIWGQHCTYNYFVFQNKTGSMDLYVLLSHFQVFCDWIAQNVPDFKSKKPKVFSTGSQNTYSAY